MNKYKKMGISNIAGVFLSVFFINNSSLTIIFNNDNPLNYFNLIIAIASFFGFKYLSDKLLESLFKKTQNNC